MLANQEPLQVTPAQARIEEALDGAIAAALAGPARQTAHSHTTAHRQHGLDHPTQLAQCGGLYARNLVNTSVTSVDTSAACASGRGMLASTDTLEEPPIVCTPMRGGMVVGVAPWAQLGLP